MPVTNEGTPLLGGSNPPTTGNSRPSFRRLVAPPKGSTATATATATTKLQRKSLRGATVDELMTTNTGNNNTTHRPIHPVDGLSPLVAGGIITTNDGNYRTHPRPPSVVKSLPAVAPFRRTARHRSFYLWWINEVRHWWKSSRLLVRLAGLFVLAFTSIFLQRMLAVTPYVPLLSKAAAGTLPNKHHKRKAYKAFEKAVAKNTKHAVKIVKQLGQGGPMRFFLKYVHPLTRTLRLLVAAWRWHEAAQCRRGEVGTEEAFAFMGNRVSRMLARLLVDSAVAYIVMPLAYDIFRLDYFVTDRQEDTDADSDWWHPVALFLTLGCLRACAPFAASFQGSRAGRVLTRTFFRAALHRWHPIQAVERLNLTSSDACEPDEVSQTSDLARMGKLVAKAFGRAHDIGNDGMEGQREALELEGFRQVGAGSGGYAVYECHRRVWTTRASSSMVDGSDTNNNNNGDDNAEYMTILLHVTPYGPSILDVMPRYVVLEFEDSVDRRDKWSEFISKQLLDGPPVVEGYCYGGAFFSPHHFAELKTTYDKQLFAYERACVSLCKPRTGRDPNPPSDLKSLKAFLANGKFGRKRKRNEHQAKELQKGVHAVANELKKMMMSTSTTSHDGTCTAPRGVILYFEGLDCAGKSSTGGLVEQALSEAGYDVGQRQYNKPPTAEQKTQAWMNRFDVPKTSNYVMAIPSGKNDDDNAATTEETNQLLAKCADHHHNALVWDRGPAGDFVYNPTYRAMPMVDRKNRHKEFMDFDKKCFDDRILFLKLLFVTNRDSIASTLGKRLAQKKMARDLRMWHKASGGGEGGATDGDAFTGLDEIEMHIDPTDFTAFNCYQTNLRIFANFARSTDTRENPWIVVNTGDRYAARKALLQGFRQKLERFKDPSCCSSSGGGGEGAPVRGASRKAEHVPIGDDEIVDIGYSKPLPIQVLIALAGLLLIAFYYGEHTTFANPFRDTWIDIEKLLPQDDGDDDDDSLVNGTVTALLLFPWLGFDATGVP